VLEHPEVTAQGETIDALEDTLRDADCLLILDNVSAEAQVKTRDV
jgi:hypothetical protein